MVDVSNVHLMQGSGDHPLAKYDTLVRSYIEQRTQVGRSGLGRAGRTERARRCRTGTASHCTVLQATVYDSAAQLQLAVNWQVTPGDPIFISRNDRSVCPRLR